MYAAEQLHAVRIDTKKLRYALELIADARIAAVRPLVNTLKRAQDTLGKLHDLLVSQSIELYWFPALLHLLDTCTETVLPQLARSTLARRRQPLKMVRPTPVRRALERRA